MLPMQGHRLLSRLFKHRARMCRKHHPHPLEYTAAAYPVQKATLPLGRFKSIGWSIPAASWCREEKEQSRWTAFLLVLLLCHDHRQFCCWHCGRCCIAGGETSHMLLRRVLVESSIEPFLHGTQHSAPCHIPSVDSDTCRLWLKRVLPQLGSKGCQSYLRISAVQREYPAQRPSRRLP